MNWVEGRDVWWSDVIAGQIGRLPGRADGRRGHCSSSSTPAVPPASPRASSTPPADTWSARISPPNMSSICRMNDVYWCTADVGWITGHSYVVYGPLLNGATTLMYEGAPNFPISRGSGRSSSGTRSAFSTPRPTAIRAFMRAGRNWSTSTICRRCAARHRRRADQSRGVDVVSRGDRPRKMPDRRHLVADRNRRDHDHAAARRTPTKPGTATLPFFGVDAAIVDRDRQGTGPIRAACW
jgi:acetyl-CoA synthetase